MSKILEQISLNPEQEKKSQVKMLENMLGLEV